jgi:hypothetical protein
MGNFFVRHTHQNQKGMFLWVGNMNLASVSSNVLVVDDLTLLRSKTDTK